MSNEEDQTTLESSERSLSSSRNKHITKENRKSDESNPKDSNISVTDHISANSDALVILEEVFTPDYNVTEEGNSSNVINSSNVTLIQIQNLNLK